MSRRPNILPSWLTPSIRNSFHDFLLAVLILFALLDGGVSTWVDNVIGHWHWGVGFSTDNIMVKVHSTACSHGKMELVSASWYQGKEGFARVNSISRFARKARLASSCQSCRRATTSYLLFCRHISKRYLILRLSEKYR